MDTANGGHDYTYRSYPQRWRMLGIVFALNVVVQIFFTTLMPIATPAAAYYNVGLTAINWIALTWAALFLPGTLFAGWMLFKHGLRTSLIAAAAALLAGAALRAVSAAFRDSGLAAYLFLLLGTVVMASVQPIVLASTTLTAAAWFSEKQRNLANTIMAVANPLGLAIGSILPPLITETSNGNSTLDHIDAYLFLQLALATAAFVAAFFMRSQPPTAPAATASYKARGANLGRDLKSLRRNFGFLALCNVFSLSVGALTALLTLLEQILRPQGYTVKDAGVVAAVLILSGIVGCAIVGPLLDRYRCYKLLLAGALTATTPFFIAFAYVSQQRAGARGALFGLAACVGLLGFPVLPTALDLSAETTYPISAGVTTAILWCCSQVTGLLLVILIDGPLADPVLANGVDPAAATPDDTVASLEAGTWLLVGCVAAAMFMSWLWSGRYVRQEAEGTVQRLRQAQRRDVGLPFVDIIAEPAMSPEPSGPENVFAGNATAAAAAPDQGAAWRAAAEPLDQA